MIFVLLLLFLLFLVSTCFVREGNEDYVGRTQTRTINGIFIILGWSEET